MCTHRNCIGYTKNNIDYIHINVLFTGPSAVCIHLYIIGFIFVSHNIDDELHVHKIVCTISIISYDSHYSFTSAIVSLYTILPEPRMCAQLVLNFGGNGVRSRGSNFRMYTSI